MKILHTSDWHVGRTVRGLSREDEHRAVLAEIAAIVRDQEIDLVLIAGDIFDHAAPSAASEEVVYGALLDLVKTGAKVALVAGNHDNQRKIEALRPLLSLASVHAGGWVYRADGGGCVEVTVRTGEVARIALLPWLSQRNIVKSADLMGYDQAENLQKYWEYWQKILANLCAGYSAKTVNLLLSHVCTADAQEGGGERKSETVFDYWIQPQVFPATAQYVALGHIHRAQQLPSPCPAWYSGSPMQLDFGERPEGQCVLVFEAKPGVPIGPVQKVAIKSGRQLLTVRGSLAALRERQTDPGLADAYLRLVVEEHILPGMADELRRVYPNAVEVRIAAALTDETQQPGAERPTEPRDLFRAYLDARAAHDDRLVKLFDSLLEEETHAAAAS